MWLTSLGADSIVGRLVHTVQAASIRSDVRVRAQSGGARALVGRVVGRAVGNAMEYIKVVGGV
jgi:uncharacterized membrane protein YecN with MAPEG domain